MPSPVDLVVGAHPAVSGVATLAAVFNVSGLQAVERVSRQGVAFGFHIDLVEPRRVQSEYLCFVFFGDFLVAELLAHLVADLEALKGINSPLRRAPPQTVR